MAKSYDKEKYLKDKAPSGELLKPILPEGELIVSEGPKGEPLWKKKKKLNEDGREETLNEEKVT